MTIAVTGATGQLGRLVLGHLLSRVARDQVVALARSTGRAGDLEVAVRPGDYDRPETLKCGLAGIQTLLLISSSEVGRRVTQHAAVIDAAVRAGVQRIVYTSLLHADRSSLSLADEHRATEAMLAGSGIAVTILRNGWYTENYTGSAAAALSAGALSGSAGNARISSAARADYAEAAAVVLAEEGHEGRVYELAGDDAWTLADLASEISRQAGKCIPYRNLAEADYAELLVSRGLPPHLAQAIAGWDSAAAGGALLDETRQLSRLIGRPTTSLAASVAEALGLADFSADALAPVALVPS